MTALTEGWPAALPSVRIVSRKTKGKAMQSAALCLKSPMLVLTRRDLFSVGIAHFVHSFDDSATPFDGEIAGLPESLSYRLSAKR